MRQNNSLIKTANQRAEEEAANRRQGGLSGIVIGQVSGNALFGGHHGLLPWLPVGRADLTVLVCEPEGLQKPDGLINRSADGKVVDSDLPQDPLVVDDKRTPEGNAGVLLVDPVRLCHTPGFIGQNRDVDGAQPSLFPLRQGEGVIGVGGVAREAEHFAIFFPKIRNSLAVSDDFGGAHPRECFRIPKEDHVLATIILQLDVFESPTDHRWQIESRSWHAGLETLRCHR